MKNTSVAPAIETATTKAALALYLSYGIEELWAADPDAAYLVELAIASLRGMPAEAVLGPSLAPAKGKH